MWNFRLKNPVEAEITRQMVINMKFCMYSKNILEE
jgi:hypothetical protein